MTNTSLLKELIAKSGYKLDYIATKLGKSRQALSCKINNKTEFTASEIETLCDILGIETEARMAIFFAK